MLELACGPPGRGPFVVCGKQVENLI